MIRDLLKTSLTVHTVTPLHLATMKGSVQFNFGYYTYGRNWKLRYFRFNKKVLEMQNEVKIKIEKEPIYDEDSG